MIMIVKRCVIWSNTYEMHYCPKTNEASLAKGIDKITDSNEMVNYNKAVYISVD